MEDHWQPGFNDPNFLGWATTGAYLLATILTLRVKKLPAPSQHKLTWNTLTFLLLFFTLNKQIDLQTWMKILGRDFTQEHALYQYKDKIRLGFMALLLLTAGGITIFLRKRFLEFLKHNILIALGLSLVVVYIVIRGVNFRLLGPLAPLELLPDPWQWLLEVSGLSLILFALFRHLAAEAVKN